MDTVLIRFTKIALDVREVVNIAIVVFAVVLCCLLVRRIVNELREQGYRDSDFVKLCRGLSLIFAGEFLRSATIWEILHYEGGHGTYLTDVVPLLVALLLIVVGSLCVIRVMTPPKLGNSVWIGSLVVVLGLIAASRLF